MQCLFPVCPHRDIYKIHSVFTCILQDEAVGGMKECNVCFQSAPGETFSCLTCGHVFCKNCWDLYFQIQIKQGITTGKKGDTLYIYKFMK
jgi:hypothetical protein